MYIHVCVLCIHVHIYTRTHTLTAAANTQLFLHVGYYSECFTFINSLNPTAELEVNTVIPILKVKKGRHRD